MRFLLTVVLAITLVAVGCENRHQGVSGRQPSTASQSNQRHSITQKPTVPEETSIPDDVSFTIIESNILPGIKRSLDIRLNKKVSKETLAAIAQELKAQDPQVYERTFMAYLLPGMTVGAGAWATTHFNPDLEVRILGLTLEEERKIAAQPEPDNSEVIGRWLDDRPFVGHRVTIFREQGKLFMEQIFPDGSSSKKDLKETRTRQGRRFDEIEGSAYGDHWLLDSDGNLQLRDDEGLISTAKKIGGGG
jgi:hypothetical protein